MNTDIGSAQEIEKLWKKIPEHNRTRDVMMFLFYKYSDYDLDKSFLPQFKSNNDKLLEVLRKMADDKDN